VGRVTTRDIIDFRDNQTLATITRCLVTLRRWFDWLTDEGHVSPAKLVKKLRRVQLTPKSLDRSQVCRLLREIELRQDVRAGAIFAVLLYTGCRVSDLIPRIGSKLAKKTHHACRWVPSKAPPFLATAMVGCRFPWQFLPAAS
jgi:site-specific recombinase XerD